MKTEKSIFIAFMLNLFFSVFELMGGIYTGSVAILSDAVHDLGDAASIGISFFLERKSKKHPDNIYTYGYRRFSVLGSIITSLILVFGSCMVIFSSAKRIFAPAQIRYDGMIVLALVGVCVNLSAAFFTHGKGSMNRRAVNLHMLEDTLGWATVLAGAVVMKFTDFWLIDPLLSLGISVFIIINAWKNLRDAVYIFLEKAPCGIDVTEIQKRISKIDNIIDVHHIHVHALDEKYNIATMHVIAKEENTEKTKQKIREELLKCGISHVTLEIEKESEICTNRICHIKHKNDGHHHRRLFVQN